MSDLNFSLSPTAKPVIREAANMNNDGGGGNLGYMRQRKKDKKNNRQYLDESIFGKKEEDRFMSEKLVECEDEGIVSKFFDRLINKIKKDETKLI